MNVKHLYITKYDISDLKKCLTTDGKVSCDDSSVEALNNVSSNFVYYLKTLSSSVEGIFVLGL